MSWHISQNCSIKLTQGGNKQDMYLDIFTEVSDWLPASRSEVIVDPPQQKVLGGHWHQVVQLFWLIQQGNESCTHPNANMRVKRNKSLTYTHTPILFIYGGYYHHYSSLDNYRNQQMTFIPRDLNISEQADFNDLPEESEHQVRSSCLQVLSVDVDHRAADSWSWVECQHQILLRWKRGKREILTMCLYLLSESWPLKWVWSLKSWSMR